MANGNILKGVTTKKQFYNLAAHKFIELLGGSANVYKQIKELEKVGELTHMQAFHLRGLVHDASKV